MLYYRAYRAQNSWSSDLQVELKRSVELGPDSRAGFDRHLGAAECSFERSVRAKMDGTAALDVSLQFASNGGVSCVHISGHLGAFQ